MEPSPTTSKAAPAQRELEVIRFPKPVAYADGVKAQLERRMAIEQGRATSALLLLEHSPVFTLGRKSSPENLLRPASELAKLGIDVCETDRGGDVTYHGPGQLVAYPILDLNQWKPSVGWYLRSLEEVLMNLLAGYGLQGERLEGLTGVWVDGAKVAAIGIAIHQWVTYHGIALNVAPNMDHWRFIVPCGIPDKPVTSLAQLLKKPPTISQAMEDFTRHFKAVFDVAS